MNKFTFLVSNLIGELRLAAPVDISNGTLVILNFYVKKNSLDHRIKTMVFAYVASCHRETEGILVIFSNGNVIALW